MVQGCRPRTQTACTDCALLFVPLHSSARRVLSISKKIKFKLVHKWCTSLFETGGCTACTACRDEARSEVRF